MYHEKRNQKYVFVNSCDLASESHNDDMIRDRVFNYTFLASLRNVIVFCFLKLIY